MSEEIDAITDTYAQFVEETIEDMQSRGIVITSYSIHYTKLYDDLPEQSR